MVEAATWVISAAVIAGTILGLWHLRAVDATGRPPGWAGIAHGICGGVGLVLLILALRGPARATAEGAGSFGHFAAFLFAAALLSGAAVWVRRRRGPAIMIVVHAGLAVTGWVLLLAWSSLG